MTVDQTSSTTRPPRRRLTIKEIAHEAGVSTATVSRALNRPEAVAEKTRQAILEVIERHHYVMDGMAMALASRRSRSIGLIIPTITNSIYASSTQAIQRRAQTAGYTVLVGVSDFSPERERELVVRLIERRVDGLILTGDERSASLFETLERNRVPFIVTWQPSASRLRPSVAFDNYRAARLAMEHLSEFGHCRIGLICGRTDVNDRARERRRAYEDHMRARAIPEADWMIYERDFEFIEGRAAMHRMLDHHSAPTAVFCANDIQAIGALSECRDRGLRVPEQISIVGFDDLPIARYMQPQLTSVRVPASQMGDLAARHLLEWIETGVTPASEILPADLVARGSTGPAPGRAETK